MFKTMSETIGPLRVDESLANAEAAMQLLKRVRDSSEPILKSHGWRVERLEEITKKLNRMSSVLGFCEYTGNKKTSTKIALVLRGDDGRLMHFVAVMGTMLHEIAHIVHGRHAGPFYRLMADLIEEWETVVMKVPKGRLLDAEGNVMSENIPEWATNGTGTFNGVFIGKGNECGTANRNWKCLCQRDLVCMAAERRAADNLRGFGDAELVPMARGMFKQASGNANSGSKRKFSDTEGSLNDEELTALIKALHLSESEEDAWSAADMRRAISASKAEAVDARHAADMERAIKASRAEAATANEKQMELDHAIALSIATAQSLR
jgi:hypothetical protein